MVSYSNTRAGEVVLTRDECVPGGMLFPLREKPVKYEED